MYVGRYEIATDGEYVALVWKNGQKLYTLSDGIRRATIYAVAIRSSSGKIGAEFGFTRNLHHLCRRFVKDGMHLGNLKINFRLPSACTIFVPIKKKLNINNNRQL